MGNYIEGMQENYLELFKESSIEPAFIKDRGKNKIFLHTLTCEEDYRRVAYGIKSVNKILEDPKTFDEDTRKLALASRMIAMINALQEGVKNGFDKNGLGRYKKAEEDYPRLYALIIDGISEKALDEISKHEMQFGTHVLPLDLGKKLADTIREDRKNGLSNIIGERSKEAIINLP